MCGGEYGVMLWKRGHHSIRKPFVALVAGGRSQRKHTSYIQVVNL